MADPRAPFGFGFGQLMTGPPQLPQLPRQQVPAPTGGQGTAPPGPIDEQASSSDPGTAMLIAQATQKLGRPPRDLQELVSVMMPVDFSEPGPRPASAPVPPAMPPPGGPELRAPPPRPGDPMAPAAQGITDMMASGPAGAFQGGQMMGQGFQDRSLPQMGAGALMTATALPFSLAPAMRPGRLEQRGGNIGWEPSAAYMRKRNAGRGPFGYPPPGGDAAWAAAGGAAGTAGGLATDQDLETTAGMALGGAGVGLGAGRYGVGAPMQRGRHRASTIAKAPTTAVPQAGPGQGMQFMRGVPRSGRAPAGGGRMADWNEQTAAVDAYLRAGNRPPQGPWGQSGPEIDAFIRQALAAYRQGGRP